MYSKLATIFRSLHYLDSVQDTTPLSIRTKRYSTLLNEFPRESNSEFWKESPENRAFYIHRLALWDLCQLFYFPTPDQECCSTTLIHWLKATDNKSVAKFYIQGIYNTKNPIHHEQFWPAVYKLIIRGELQTLVALLTQARKRVIEHSHDDGLLLLIGALLQVVSKFPILANLPRQDYLEQKQAWQHTCSDLTKNIQNFVVDMPLVSDFSKHVLDGIELLKGNQDTIDRLGENKLEGLVALIYYAYPLASRSNIRELAKKYWINEEGEFKDFKHLFQGNIEAILAESQLDLWYLAHLTDVLVLFGVDSLKDKREESVLAYSKYLLDIGLWLESLDYMSTCGTQGRELMHKTIRQLEIKDENMAKELLACCDNFYMNDEKNRLYKETGNILQSSKKYAAAIPYYDQAGDFEAIDTVFKNAMDSYANTRQLTDFGNLSPDLKARFNGPYAKFYLGFFELHNFMETKQYKKAARQFHDLLKSPSSPIEYIPLLYVQGIGLLQNPAPWFSAEEYAELELRFKELGKNEDLTGYTLLGNMLLKDKKLEEIMIRDTFFDLLSLVLKRSPYTV
ncbi:Nup85 nucleoporin-domain-containing protein [Phycomyces nitens]|nr:Nup85 nucleoporin-domain-containing protein [Phycomyces nitens]